MCCEKQCENCERQVPIRHAVNIRILAMPRAEPCPAACLCLEMASEGVIKVKQSPKGRALIP